MNTDYDSLWDHVVAQFGCGRDSVHGPDHWKRVLRNGLLIARHTSGASEEVVRLFALFHDSKRESDGTDEGHGKRGAEFAASLRGVLFELSDVEFALLDRACRWHTMGLLTDEPTLGSCWDADRLDLARVGIRPMLEWLLPFPLTIGRQVGSI